MSTSAYVKQKTKAPWYYAPIYLAFWLVLFFAVIMPVFFYLPDALTAETEHSHSGEFIGERAEHMLYDFDIIGPKVVGSRANENVTVQFLYDQIDKIRRVMHDDLFEIEVDLQEVSGGYVHWHMINMYQGLQNFVVKFSPKNATSQSYLLINSHFDTKPGSPGAGDAGAMVVIMLEILRVLATTRQTFTHPVVFLFNGAEENPLQASHGFITQHKWARNCKVLINLDSAGSGNREILFQSGPNHPWLMNYYGKHVGRPFANTMAEELFQSGVIPSDTDFRIFRDFGNVPGLDLAHFYNGFVYHTKFDKFNVIPMGTLQITGDNVLALTRGFVNATELENPMLYAEGHVVFYDFLNVFFIYYTDTQALIVNICMAIVAILLVGISLWRMAATSYVSICKVCRAFGFIFVLHVIGFLLAFGLPLLIAYVFDEADHTLTWFANKWFVIGLYVCPTLFGLCAPTLLYLSFSRNDKLTHSFKLQMVLHAHSIILAVTCIIVTCFGIRSSYLFMISLFFYNCAMIINLLTTLHERSYFWSIFVIVSQALPFIYFSYIFHAFLCSLIPMTGRFGISANPDLYIAFLCALGTVLAMGYLIPLLNLFQRPKSVLPSLLLITIVFGLLTLTPLGFPYRAKTNVERINFLEVRRVFYERDGTVSLNESGFYFDFQDRRSYKPIATSVNLTKLRSTAPDCQNYMMCGLPLYNHRWFKARLEGYWLPTEALEMPETPKLQLLVRSENATTKTVRFEFELDGPPHMSIFIQPMTGIIVNDWSFIKDMLETPEDWLPPYHIFYSYGKDDSPLEFYIEFEVLDGNMNDAIFELGISAHYVSHEHERSPEAKKFISNLPEYAYPMEWPSSYERYIF